MTVQDPRTTHSSLGSLVNDALEQLRRPGHEARRHKSGGCTYPATPSTSHALQPEFNSIAPSQSQFRELVLQAEKALARGDASTADRLFSEVQSALQPEDQATQIRVLEGRLRTSYWLGDLVQAASYISEVLTLLDSTHIISGRNKRILHVYFLVWSSDISTELGKPGAALESVRTAAHITNTTNAPINWTKYWLSQINRAFGRAYTVLADWHLAERYLFSALEQAESSEHHDLAGAIEYATGWLRLRQGDYRDALSYSYRSYERLRPTILGRRLQALESRLLSEIAFEIADGSIDDDTSAVLAEVLDDSLEEFRGAQSWLSAVQIQLQRSRLSFLRHHLGDAIAGAQEAAAFCRERGLTFDLGRSLRHLGVALQEQDERQGIRLLQESIAILNDYDDLYELSLSRRALGDLLVSKSEHSLEAGQIANEHQAKESGEYEIKEQPEHVYDPSPSLRIEVAFDSPAERARARRLVSIGREVVNIPPCSLGVDIQQLAILKESGVPVYDPSTAGTSPKKPLVIDDLIEEIRNVERTVSIGEKPTIRSA